MGPNKSTSSDAIDKINYGRSFNVLKAANADRYLESLSHEDVLLKKLSTSSQDLSSLSKDSLSKFITMLANVYQSVTTKGLTTYEITSYVVNAINDFEESERKEVLKLIRNYFAIFHMDYTTFDKSLSDNEKEVLNHILYKEASCPAGIFGFFKQQTSTQNDRFFSTSNFLNFGRGQNKRDYKELIDLNTNPAASNKNTPNLSVILLNNNNLRGGVKNSLELSTFFNLIPSLEYAKAYPYFNATFVLPSISRQDKKSIFKTATLNQFLFGGVENDKKNKNFKNFEGEIFKDEVGVGVKTNLSVFTTPQTVVNMNEKIGHNEILSSDKKRLRITNVHDQTRPFMTLKDFTIDVSPTKGMMSFKTGKISLILHDRTRMVDIAPFIKPDLFGAFGAEIIVEYGWSHNESQSSKLNSKISTNPIGDFLDSSRCIEKYMIVNSQFTIENNGQVNINLSIAMKGPIDIRQTEIFADSTKAIDINVLNAAISEYSVSMNDLTGKNSSGFQFNTNTVGLMTNLLSKKKIKPKTRQKLNRQIRDLKKFQKVYSLWIKKGFSESSLGRYTAYSQLIQSSKLTKEQEKVLLRYIEFKELPGGFLTAEQIGIIRDEVYPSIEKITKIIQSNLDYDDKLKEKQNEFIDDLIGGTQENDMFIDQYLIGLISKKEKSSIAFQPRGKFAGLAGSADLDALEQYYVEDISFENYVSLGTIITSLISTHMVPTKKYDEIQLVFHTVNDYAGLASKYKKKVTDDDDYSLNIASLLIKRSYLKEYLENLFESKTRLTLESLLSQIIKKFAITKDNPCYGLSHLYTRKDASSPVKPNKKVKEKDKNDRLNQIYYGDNTDIYDDEPQFLPPDIHLTFDALTSRENKNLTICRITVYDRNNNPYQSIADLYNQTFNQKTKSFRRLQQLSKELESKKISPADRKAKNSLAKKLIDELTRGEKAIFEKVVENDLEFFRFKTGFGFDDLKRKYKKIVPAATFASQNTSLISASVATVNEGKLNTVYITRQDRNKTNEINNQVIIDSPLRILPAQASIELFGCPWINFGQYIFLDFETGTTIDNTYAVTGLKHTISPGKFTTQVTLSYGDVYGKYEGIADGFNNALSKFVDAPKQIKEEKPETVVAKVSKTRTKKGRLSKKKHKSNTFTVKDIIFLNTKTETSDEDLNESFLSLLENFTVDIVDDEFKKMASLIDDDFNKQKSNIDTTLIKVNKIKADEGIEPHIVCANKKNRKNKIAQIDNYYQNEDSELHINLLFKTKNSKEFSIEKNKMYSYFLFDEIDKGLSEKSHHVVEVFNQGIILTGVLTIKDNVISKFGIDVLSTDEFIQINNANKYLTGGYSRKEVGHGHDKSQKLKVNNVGPNKEEYVYKIVNPFSMYHSQQRASNTLTRANQIQSRLHWTELLNSGNIDFLYELYRMNILKYRTYYNTEDINAKSLDLHNIFYDAKGIDFSKNIKVKNIVDDFLCSTLHPLATGKVTQTTPDRRTVPQPPAQLPPPTPQTTQGQTDRKEKLNWMIIYDNSKELTFDGARSVLEALKKTKLKFNYGFLTNSFGAELVDDRNKIIQRVGSIGIQTTLALSLYSSSSYILNYHQFLKNSDINAFVYISGDSIMFKNEVKEFNTNLANYGITTAKHIVLTSTGICKRSKVQKNSYNPSVDKYCIDHKDTTGILDLLDSFANE